MATDQEKVTPPAPVNATAVESPATQEYFFPKVGKTITATSLAEAMTKLEDLLKQDSKN